MSSVNTTLQRSIPDFEQRRRDLAYLAGLYRRAYQQHHRIEDALNSRCALGELFVVNNQQTEAGRAQ